ncbi:hypothetical protein AcW1_006569 [Taiwanofungus camphoratus]|nr:hypothetical protein AcV5_009155 [Antrodia cinnamomea]KAI0924446.1 hypothetical protein AcW2_005329 [Antrodia cinnamomea]KAI0954783.1 hypothetical protein AcW1_006569 [Antrodia cinnamomea]
MFQAKLAAFARERGLGLNSLLPFAQVRRRSVPFSRGFCTWSLGTSQWPVGRRYRFARLDSTQTDRLRHYALSTISKVASTWVSLVSTSCLLDEYSVALKLSQHDSLLNFHWPEVYFMSALKSGYFDCTFGDHTLRTLRLPVTSGPNEGTDLNGMLCGGLPQCTISRRVNSL